MDVRWFKISNKLIRLLLFLYIFFILVGLTLIIYPEDKRIPLLTGDSWLVIDGFDNPVEPQKGQLPESILIEGDGLFFRSWSQETNALRGRIVSQPFFCDRPAISLPVSGYFQTPGNHMYLENLATGDRISFKYGDAHETWQELIVLLPNKWHNQQMQIVAESSGTAYLGLGIPFGVGWMTILKTSLFTSLAWHFLIFVFMLSITSAFRKVLAFYLLPFNSIAQWLFLPLSIALVSYFLFFGYYFFPFTVPYFAGILVLTGLFADRKMYISIFKDPQSFIKHNLLLIVWFMVALVAWLCLNAQETVSIAFAANYRFSPASWSTDNQLPLVIAEALHKGLSTTSEINIGPWQISDRGPGFIGIIALIYSYTKPLFDFDSARQLYVWIANLAGIVVLSTWVFPVWVFLLRHKISISKRVWIIWMLAFTPFIFFNTIFIWAKMLSASLALTAWLLLEPRKMKTLELCPAIGSGLAFAAALLAHGGIAFSHLAMGFWLLFTQFRVRWGTFLVCGIIFLSLLMPWFIWVQQVDPPGNALTKYAFAGTFGFDSKDQSLYETVVDAYRSDSWSDWLSRKSNSVKTLFGLYQPHVWWEYPGLVLRHWQFFYLFPALGPYLLFLLIYFERFRHTSYKLTKSIRGDHLGPFSILSIGFLGLFIQLLLFWGPFTLHEISYGTVLFLHLGMITLFVYLKSNIKVLITLMVLFNFFFIWLVSPAFEFGHVRLMTFIASLVIICGLGFVLITVAKTSSMFCRSKAESNGIDLVQ